MVDHRATNIYCVVQHARPRGLLGTIVVVAWRERYAPEAYHTPYRVLLVHLARVQFLPRQSDGAPACTTASATVGEPRRRPNLSPGTLLGHNSHDHQEGHTYWTENEVSSPNHDVVAVGDPTWEVTPVTKADKRGVRSAELARKNRSTTCGEEVEEEEDQEGEGEGNARRRRESVGSVRGAYRQGQSASENGGTYARAEHNR